MFSFLLNARDFDLMEYRIFFMFRARLLLLNLKQTQRLEICWYLSIFPALLVGASLYVVLMVSNHFELINLVQKWIPYTAHYAFWKTSNQTSFDFFLKFSLHSVVPYFFSRSQRHSISWLTHHHRLMTCIIITPHPRWESAQPPPMSQHTGSPKFEANNANHFIF